MKRFRKFRRAIVGAGFAIAIVGIGVSAAPRQAKAISYECESFVRGPMVPGRLLACVWSIIYSQVDP